MEKMTKRNVFEALINLATDGELVYGEGRIEIMAEDLKAFAENEIALLDKRAGRAKATAAKKRAEGDALMEAVEAALTDEFEPTADIAARVEGDEVTVAKITYRLNKLVANGVAEKTDMKIPATETTKARTVKGFRRLIAE